jgi:nucleotidyltransferase substrate binding protein (TIGR01987 family)
MAKLKRLEQFEKALKNFRTSLTIRISEFPYELRDTVESGQIQKFEMCYELLWKAGKEILRELEGIEVSSPKRVLKSLFHLGYMDYDEFELCIEMLENRNLLSHVYRKEVVEQILPELSKYADEMEKLLLRFKMVVEDRGND